MIGIFDSGVGGFTALYEVRRLVPRADILYLADRANAPYGTKSDGELISLVTEDIRRLTALGAEKILIACCTASTVWESLDEGARRLSIPIIRPAANAAARLSANGIAVIATEATVRSHSFAREISSLSPHIPVSEIAAQELVSLVEGGCRDGRVKEEDMKILSATAEKINKTKADTLILGCTHFSHLEKTLSALTGTRAISPAKEGARLIVKECATAANGRGRTVYV